MGGPNSGSTSQWAGLYFNLEDDPQGRSGDTSRHQKSSQSASRLFDALHELTEVGNDVTAQRIFAVFKEALTKQRQSYG